METEVETESLYHSVTTLDDSMGPTDASSSQQSSNTYIKLQKLKKIAPSAVDLKTLSFPIYNVRSAVKYFAHRDELLHRIEEKYARIVHAAADYSGQPNVNLVLTGAAGVGKTEIALTFAHHCVRSGNFSIVWYFACSNRQNRLLSYRNLAAELGMDVDDIQHSDSEAEELIKLSAAVHEFLDHQELPLPYLLVFDGVESDHQYPNRGACVLATSRHPELFDEQVWESIPVQPFSPQQRQAADLFVQLRATAEQEPPAVDSLVQALCHHPLLVSHAALLLNSLSTTASSAHLLSLHTYLQRFSAALTQVEATMCNSMPSHVIRQHPLCAQLTTAWVVGVDALLQEQDGATAVQWLQVMAQLHVEASVPAHWIGYWHRLQHGTAASSAAASSSPVPEQSRAKETTTTTTTTTTAAAAATAASSSQLSQEEEQFVARIVQLASPFLKVVSFGQHACHSILRMNPVWWELFRILTVDFHERRVVREIPADELLDKTAVDGWKQAIRLLHEVASCWDFTEEQSETGIRTAFQWSIQAMILLQSSFTAHCPADIVKEVTMLLNEVAILHQLLGLYTSALDMYQIRLEVTKQLHGSQAVADRELALSYEHLGMALRLLGRLDEALTSYETALDMFKQIHGTEQHAEVAQQYREMSLILCEMERLPEASQLAEKSLTICKELYPDRDEAQSDIAHSYHVLSVLLDKMNLTDQSVELKRKVLAIEQKVYGAEPHSNVAAAYNNLGVALSKMGNDLEAAAMCEQALAIYRSLYGNDHPDVQLTLKNLVRVEQSRFESDSCTLL